MISLAAKPLFIFREKNVFLPIKGPSDKVVSDFFQKSFKMRSNFRSRDGAISKISKILTFFYQTMETLTVYKKQLKEQIDTQTTLSEI